MTTWRKSSYSAAQTQCVEVNAIPWRKSSYSGDTGGNCVETGTAPGTVLIRDTADRGRVTLSLPAPTWRAFITSLNHAG